MRRRCSACWHSEFSHSLFQSVSKFRVVAREKDSSPDRQTTPASIVILNYAFCHAFTDNLLPPVLDAPSGFPSPAEDYIDQRLNLNEHLIIHPAATCFFRVRGDSMRAAGIASGDLLAVDRSIEPRPGHAVMAVVEGGLAVKRLKLAGRQLVLTTEAPESPLPKNAPWKFEGCLFMSYTGWRRAKSVDRPPAPGVGGIHADHHRPHRLPNDRRPSSTPGSSCGRFQRVVIST